MLDELSKIEDSFRKDLREVRSTEDAETVRVHYVGRKGSLTLFLRSIKSLPKDERGIVGKKANELRVETERLIHEKKEKFEDALHDTKLQEGRLDVTRPGIKSDRGSIHPITRVFSETRAIFSTLGFETVEGPEVETEGYNFDALNIPEDHPAREMWDTFWLRSNQKEHLTKSQNSKFKSQRLLLRTHTSPVQVRYMEKHNPPLRIVVPGRVYRYEATDASHDIQFYQVEGLMVDRRVSIATFKAIIQEFFSRLFKKKVEIRLRPSYFPFTEPSFEVDITCTSCMNSKSRCSICKGTGWLELAGAGMVHPGVFKAAGYNPKNWQGFAFGFGIDRIAMMKYKIPDIRLFHSGDLRFLKQF